VAELLVSNCSVLFLSLPLGLILGDISVLNMGDARVSDHHFTTYFVPSCKLMLY